MGTVTVDCEPIAGSPSSRRRSHREADLSARYAAEASVRRSKHPGSPLERAAPTFRPGVRGALTCEASVSSPLGPLAVYGIGASGRSRQSCERSGLHFGRVARAASPQPHLPLRGFQLDKHTLLIR